MTYLFDTTAVLAHYLDEPGAERVAHIVEDSEARIVTTSITTCEMARKISELLDDPAAARSVALEYLQLFDSVVPIDVTICTRAFELSATSSSRVPIVDALIAAAAQVSEAVLVHRDQHFLSMKSVRQKYLG